MPLVVMVLAILCAAVVGASDGPGQAQTDAAKTYADRCAMCHGTSGGGDGAAAAALDPKPTDFTSAEYQQSRTDEEIAAVISNGKGVMPAFKSQLTAEEIKQLVGYLRSLGPKQ